MWCVLISARASASVWSGWMVSGLTTMPDSNFFTWRTWAACSSALRFLWITPMPPCCAMAMAIGASVTVSMAEEISGMFSGMLRVSRVRVSVADGQHLGIGGHHQHVVEGQRLHDPRGGVAADPAGAALRPPALQHCVRTYYRAPWADPFRCGKPPADDCAGFPTLASPHRLSGTPAQARRGSDPPCSIRPAEPRGDDVELARFLAAGRRLGVAHHGEMPLHRCQHVPFGAALEHLGDEAAASAQDADGEIAAPARPAP